MDRVVDKYLEGYAEREVAALADFPRDRRFQNGVVIPAFAESAGFLHQFSRSRFAGCLVVLVINQPADGGPTLHPHPENRALAERIRCMGDLLWQNGNLSLIDCGEFSILAVDRFSRVPIPSRQGVGLARKIGCDLAVRLYRRGLLRSSYIHTTDADARLPEDYFSQLRRDRSYSAQIYDFSHRCDDSAVGRATEIYERSLRYYVAGLRLAGSAYAFPALGSCLAVSAVHYCQARGFPRRSGGEDFYLLNKLAKLAPVAELAGDPVRITARHSDRAPFGTGPAVSRIMAAQGSDRPDYNPLVFVELGKLLARFAELPAAVSAGAPERWLDSLNRESRDAILSLGIERLFGHLIGQRLGEDGMGRHIQWWFDGFRTLKFIHFLQREYYPPVPLEEAEKSLWICVDQSPQGMSNRSQ